MGKSKDRSWGSSLRQPEISSGGKEARDLVSSTIEEWYLEKHRKPTAGEISLINSLKVGTCPVCGSADIAKDGKLASGIRRFRCKSCGRRFNPLTSTVFDSRKIPLSERIEFLLHLFEFHSLTTSARDNKNDGKTGVFWLSQIFATLEGWQGGVKLSGRVWIDETFISVDSAERKAKEDGKMPRGISRNKICIATATDGKMAVFVATKASKPSKKAILSALGGHIAPGSTLVHDGDNSHSLLVERLHLKSEIHKTSETKGLPDRDNPMDAINDVHSKLKIYLRAHGSFKRQKLQGWLDLFSFIWNPPRSRYDKVVSLIERAISQRKRIKFRDVYPKKSDED